MVSIIVPVSYTHLDVYKRQASAAAKESSVQIKNNGTLHLANAKFVVNDEGKLVLTSQMCIRDRW